MRDIYVVTHPEATHHVEDRVGGWFDSSLTERGHAHAKLIADHLVTDLAPAAALFTSDLTRCVQTAEHIAEVIGTTPVLLSELREKSYGEGEGRPDAWFRDRFVPPPAVGDRMNHIEGIPGSETKAQWAERVYEGMTSILRSPAEQIVVVTHGGTATLVIAHWIGMPLASLSRVRFVTPSGSITHLKRDAYFNNHSVETLGSTTHLEVPRGTVKAIAS